MRIQTKEDGTARCIVEDYADLLQIRTLSEWHPVDEDPFTVSTTVGNLSAVGLAAPHEDLIFPDPNPALFDYQRWIVDMALDRERFADIDLGLRHDEADEGEVRQRGLHGGALRDDFQL